MLLAFQDDAWRRDYLKTADLKALTSRTVTDRRRLARILETVRTAGFAATIGEVTPDVAGFAAPVFEPNGQVSTALIVAAPIERGRAAAECLTRIVIDTARKISQALSHRAAREIPLASIEARHEHRTAV